MYGLGILKGLSVTWKRFWDTYIDDISWALTGKKRYRTEEGVKHRSSKNARGIFTVQYPEEKLIVPEEFRFVPFLVYEEKDGKKEPRCTACGMCMKICPTGGLQPTWGEAGLEGLWTPHLVPRIGYCQYSCNLCGQVCPTEAIRSLPLEEKQATKIGLAAFDTTRCIPYAYGRFCGVCEEHCPIPDKAIYYVEVERIDRDGNRSTLKQPRVDPDKCIGCGICEFVCVFRDRPAIRVFSGNESRHPNTNQPILPGGDGFDPYG